MRVHSIRWLAIGLGLSIAAAQAPRPDVKGSQDHPLLTRMPNYYIESYVAQDFASERYSQEKIGKPQYTAEGKRTYIRYWIQPGATAPAALQIVRNYENALKSIGAVITWTSPYNVHAVVERGGRRTWVRVGVPESRYYELAVVEEQALRQEVVANAAVLQQGIQDSGHAAVYGIHFDTGKAVIKAESEPALKEVAGLLEKNPTLKLHIVGHTDSTGDFSQNMKLSEERAGAVLSALVSRYKINPARLRASGAGPLAPVASNRSEEGKASNRRVELVEQD